MYRNVELNALRYKLICWEIAHLGLKKMAVPFKCSETFNAQRGLL